MLRERQMHPMRYPNPECYPQYMVKNTLNIQRTFCVYVHSPA